MVVGADIDGILVDGAALMELGSWSHLIARFFDVLRADPLTEDEHREVESWLDDGGEVTIYWEQPVADQRHGLEAARRIAAAWEGRRDLVRAALLHDVGKRRSNLGVVARSLASLLAKLGIPVRGSWRLYLEHGVAGSGGTRPVGCGASRGCIHSSPPPWSTGRLPDRGVGSIEERRQIMLRFEPASQYHASTATNAAI